MTVTILSRLHISGPSIEKHLIDVGDRSSGFDYMRLILAISVIFFHSIEFSSPTSALPFLTHLPFGLWDLSIVPMFFTLSGFLVAGSLDRSRSLLDFVGLRILRIFPALVVDTIFAAIILGALLNSLSLNLYFTSNGFRVYFLNMFGDIHYQLPGLFTRNPYHFVNAQLWTIPYELICYIALIGMKLTGIYDRKIMFLILALVIIILEQHWMSVLGFTNYRHAMVIPSFLAGVVIHLYRDLLPRNRSIFFISLLVLGATAIMPHMIRFLPIPLAYSTIFIGTLNPKRIWLIRTGDYSYGLYLYGFPIAQALISILPAAEIWYVSFGLTMLATACLAALSWHLVEKRCLGFKPYLFRFNTGLLDLWPWKSRNQIRVAGRGRF